MDLVVFFPKNRKHILAPLYFECIFFSPMRLDPWLFSLLGQRTSFVVCMFLAVQVRNQRKRAQFFGHLGLLAETWENDERERQRNCTWGFVMIWQNSTDGSEFVVMIGSHSRVHIGNS